MSDNSVSSLPAVLLKLQCWGVVFFFVALSLSLSLQCNSQSSWQPSWLHSCAQQRSELLWPQLKLKSCLWRYATIPQGSATEWYITFCRSFSVCDWGKVGVCGRAKTYLRSFPMLLSNPNVFLPQKAARVGVLEVKICPYFPFLTRDKYGQCASLLG